MSRLDKRLQKLEMVVDTAEDMVKLQVHLIQRFLHVEGIAA